MATLETTQLPSPRSAEIELESLVRSQLENAVDAERRGLKVYESLHNLNEVIGAQYGDRVLYELIQNAHDAHRAGEHGKISIRLAVRSETDGALYIANGGTGFRRQDIEAVRNLAISAKEIGEGIGNKGLGFRSIEALTDDVQIFSQAIARRFDHFDGYCFRFASIQEIEELLCSYNVESKVAAKVARTIPRYLVPLPVIHQSDEILAFAHAGYATVIVIRLQSAPAVSPATKQVQALANLDVPLLLFLDRIGEIQIDLDAPLQPPYRKVLRRTQIAIADVRSPTNCALYEVDVGEGRRFLVVRSLIDRGRVLKAVEESIPLAPQLKRWLNWKGEPAVSIAVGLSRDGVSRSRLYNFLPMGEMSLSPLQGYLDAPFFADIDRRSADLALPLNKALIEAAAEACVASALCIIDRRLAVPDQAVFDLIAWTGDQAGKLDNALVRNPLTLHRIRKR
jgi:anti-sigma regulatory factor (Ser/Thr protein kinase)